MRHDFVDERAIIKTILMSSYQKKTIVPFYLRKKRSESNF